jgi:hypothetical protein
MRLPAGACSETEASHGKLVLINGILQLEGYARLAGLSTGKNNRAKCTYYIGSGLQSLTAVCQLYHFTVTRSLGACRWMGAEENPVSIMG